MKTGFFRWVESRPEFKPWTPDSDAGESAPAFFLDWLSYLLEWLPVDGFDS